MTNIGEIRAQVAQCDADLTTADGPLAAGASEVKEAVDALVAHEDIKNESRDLCVEIGSDLEALTAKLGQLAMLLGEGAAVNTGLTKTLQKGMDGYRAAHDLTRGVIDRLSEIYDGQDGTAVGTLRGYVFNCRRLIWDSNDTVAEMYMLTEALKTRSSGATERFQTHRTTILGVIGAVQTIKDTVETTRGEIYEVDDDKTWQGHPPAETAAEIIERTEGDFGLRAQNERAKEHLGLIMEQL